MKRPRWPDVVISLAQVGFGGALLPSIISEDKPAWGTSALTAALLLLMVPALVRLGARLSATLTMVNAVLWMLLLGQAVT